MADESTGEFERQMDPQNSTFIRLYYYTGSDPSDGARLPLLVVGNQSGIEVVIAPNWQENLDLESREYLEGLIADWRSLDSGQIPALLRQISELSMGPLRAVESGVTDAEGRVRLVGEFAKAGKASY